MFWSEGFNVFFVEKKCEGNGSENISQSSRKNFVVGKLVNVDSIYSKNNILNFNIFFFMLKIVRLREI